MELFKKTEPGPIEQAAKFQGLSTKEEIDRLRASIDGKLSILAENQGRPPEETYTTEKSEKKAKPWTKKQYAQYVLESQEDLADFNLRLQRLKLRVLKQYLAGGAQVFQENGSDRFTQSTTSYFGSLRDLMSKTRQVKEPKDFEVKMLEVVHELNKRLPSEFTLAEATYSQNDLEQMHDLVSSMLYKKESTENQKRECEKILDEVKNMESKLLGLADQGELFTSLGSNILTEQQQTKLWEQYRHLLKQVATFEELDSWFSPTYGSSGKGQRGHNQASEPFRTDYQRFLMPEARKLEARFKNEYLRLPNENQEAVCLLFNNGLSALKAIIELIDSRAKLLKPNTKPTVFKTKDMYFEVDDMIERHYKDRNTDLREFEPGDTQDLIEKIKSELPLAVYLIPLANSYTMDVTQVTAILEGLCDKNWINRTLAKNDEAELNRPIHIVIDNSTLGRLAKWQNFNFKRLPAFVKVIAFESLIKYGQDGQELVQAGLASDLTARISSSDLEHVRMHGGYMPPESTIRRLEAVIPGDLNDKKMTRHSRNARLIAEVVQDSIDEHSFISEVVIPKFTKPETNAEMIDNGGLFNLHINVPEYVSYLHRQNPFGRLDRYSIRDGLNGVVKAYNMLITKLAKAADIEINQGTSYGFHTTRIAKYDYYRDLKVNADPLELDSIPYIRIGTGTENLKNITLIAEIIRRANEIFSRAILDLRLTDLCREIMSPTTKVNLQ